MGVGEFRDTLPDTAGGYNTRSERLKSVVVEAVVAAVANAAVEVVEGVVVSSTSMHK